MQIFGEIPFIEPQNDTQTILCVHVKINKCSFEPFRAWILF